MKYTSVLLCLVLMCIFCVPSGTANAITTTYHGETVEWELSHSGGVPIPLTFQYCEDVLEPTELAFYGKCYYVGAWPPLGVELYANAMVTPAQNPDPELYLDYTSLDLCFPYYDDCLRDENCSPLFVEDWALFYPESTYRESIPIVYQRVLFQLPSTSHKRTIFIDVTLLQPPAYMYTINSLPWLKGRHLKQTRMRPRHGLGPGT